MFIFTKPNSGSISNQLKALPLVKENIKSKVVVSGIKDLFSTRVTEVDSSVEIFIMFNR